MSVSAAQAIILSPATASPAALDVTRRAPELVVAPEPDQAVLDEIQRSLRSGATAA